MAVEGALRTFLREAGLGGDEVDAVAAEFTSLRSLADASADDPRAAFSKHLGGNSEVRALALAAAIRARADREVVNASKQEREWALERTAMERLSAKATVSSHTPRVTSSQPQQPPPQLRSGDSYHRFGGLQRKQQSIASLEGRELASRVRPEDYPGGEADVIAANYMAAALTWDQMCGEVIESGDTLFNFDAEICNNLFDVIDNDGSGHLSMEEVLGAGASPAVVRVR